MSILKNPPATKELTYYILQTKAGNKPEATAKLPVSGARALGLDGSLRDIRQCLRPTCSSTAESSHSRERKQTDLLSGNNYKIWTKYKDTACEVLEGMSDQTQAELEWEFTVGRDL